MKSGEVKVEASVTRQQTRKLRLHLLLFSCIVQLHSPCQVRKFIQCVSVLIIWYRCSPISGLLYEEEPINRSQMDIKRENVIFERGEKKRHLLLDISSTNTDTVVPSLYRCVETRNSPLNCCLSHFRTSVSTSSSSVKRLPPKVEPLYATNTSQREQETFLYKYPFALSPFVHKECTTERCSSVADSLSTVAILTTEPASEHAHARLLPRLSWSWTVVLPGDTQRKPITSTTAVLLPFVTYLLALPRTLGLNMSRHTKVRTLHHKVEITEEDEKNPTEKQST
jgi:hypothetical protein